ncbi:MAG: hypothetical protein DRI79_05230 [Chloroflexi bacterium]|nr:MAG: hypothetical protein DRI79_05230 [Chloroflexota bacterium]
MSSISAIVPKTRRLIGREAEEQILRQAIEGDGLRVVYITGKAGLGKTRLLEHLPTIIGTSRNSDDCLWSGIVDLYDPEKHSNSGLEAAIANALDPERQAFAGYWKARKEFERQRRAGADPYTLEQLRKELIEKFSKDFNTLSREKRPIIALDTVELVQYESDIVQQVCGIEPQGIEVREWLTLNLPRLENAVFVLAGRPKPELAQDLRRAFGERLVEIELQPWPSEEQTLEYFAAVEEELPPARREPLSDMSADWRRVVHYYTGGHPLKVTLTIELLLMRLSLPLSFGDPLEEALQRTPAQLAEIQEQVERELVDRLMKMKGEDEPATVLYYMAVARKGMDARLLHYLLGEGWPEKRCRRVLRSLRRWSFVKTRPRSGVLFLHDEMYDLLERHAPVPDREWVAGRIAEYYQQRIEDLQAAGLSTERRRRRWQTLQTEQLYYKLLADRQAGYADYRRRAVEAIFTHQVGFDMSLRDEMLRFFHDHDAPIIWQRINRDSAVLWVERYNAMGLHERAYQVAADVLASDRPDFVGGRDDPLFMAALLAGQGTALAMQGRDLGQAAQLLQDAIARLEPASPPGEEWNRARILGSAYNRLGYIGFMQKKYTPAIDAYTKALPYLRQAQLWAHLADAEKNLARVYSLLGRHREAVALCDDSLELFQRANNHYGEAYSLNVLGQIRTDMEHFYRGYIHSREALDIFRQLKHRRGIGLALYALGEATRKRASFEEYTLGEAERLFHEAEDHLEEAQEYLTEPLRRAYARNELGCVYRDWAAVRRRHERSFTELLGQARKHLEEAAEVKEVTPEWRTHKADCYEDLAQVEFIRGPEGYAEALNWLDEAEGSIEPQYRITEQGLPAIEEPVQGYWVMLGKTELLRGHIAFAEGRAKEDSGQDPDPDYQKAIQHYVLATAYFEAFSPQAHELKTTLDSMYDRLRKLSVRRLARLRSYAEDVAGGYNLDVARFLDMFDSTLGAIKLISEERLV